MRSYCVIVALLVSMANSLYAADLVNVALFKETIASSGTRNAALAVDGNSDQNYKHGSCTHSDDEYQPYWEVDLGTSYVIAFIKVYNRLDCCSARLSNVKVSVSTDHVTYAQYGYHLGTIRSTYEFYPESPVVVGRWVKILLVDVTDVLTMCEIEIMSNMAYSREYLRINHNAEGTGNMIVSSPVESKTQCVVLCVQDEGCHSVNIRRDMTSLIQMQCQLLSHVSYSTTSDKNVTFWTMVTDF